MTRNLSYTPHLVTYVDILGFRELVHKQHPNFISRIIRRVIETTKPDEVDKKENEENYVNFSDLIVHTVPINSRSNVTYPSGVVYSEILGLVHAQAELIDEGLLIRGAVTIGDIERSYRVIFGPGLISAYDLEQKSARFPRIIVDAALLRATKKNRLLRFHDKPKDEMKYISALVQKDDDGVAFIDYLGGMQDEFREPDHYVSFLDNHKKLISKGLSDFAGNRKILRKYRWLRKYHNRVIRKRLKPKLHRQYCVKL